MSPVFRFLIVSCTTGAQVSLKPLLKTSFTVFSITMCNINGCKNCHYMFMILKLTFLAHLDGACCLYPLPILVPFS